MHSSFTADNTVIYSRAYISTNFFSNFRSKVLPRGILNSSIDTRSSTLHPPVQTPCYTSIILISVGSPAHPLTGPTTPATNDHLDLCGSPTGDWLSSLWSIISLRRNSRWGVAILRPRINGFGSIHGRAHTTPKYTTKPSTPRCWTRVVSRFMK